MRNRIIMAAAEEIRVKGFKFTMSDLTKRLSVSKTSLYEHFASKNELIGAMLDMAIREIDDQEEQIYEQAQLSLEDKFRTILTTSSKQFGPLNDQIYEDLCSCYPNEWQKVAEYQEKRLNRLTDLLIAGIDQGTIRSVNLAVLRQTIIGAMNYLKKSRFLIEHNLTYMDAVGAMADMIMTGLQQKEG